LPRRPAYPENALITGDLKQRAPETISFWMKSQLFTQPVGFATGFLCILACQITRAMAKETRRKIDQRKAGSGVGTDP
jgi:hypothetical protein